MQKKGVNSSPTTSADDRMTHLIDGNDTMMGTIQDRVD